MSSAVGASFENAETVGSVQVLQGRGLQQVLFLVTDLASCQHWRRGIERVEVLKESSSKGLSGHACRRVHFYDGLGAKNGVVETLVQSERSGDGSSARVKWQGSELSGAMTNFELEIVLEAVGGQQEGCKATKVTILVHYKLKTAARWVAGGRAKKDVKEAVKWMNYGLYHHLKTRETVNPQTKMLAEGEAQIEMI